MVINHYLYSQHTFTSISLEIDTQPANSYPMCTVRLVLHTGKQEAR